MRGLTVSSPRPVNILSVVAATLPPFLCKSHMISLRFNCGNICDICSTWAGSIMRPRERPAPFAPPLLPSRFKNQRITRKETTANVSKEGMLMEGSSSTIFSGGCGVMSGQLDSYPRPDARRVKLNEQGDDKNVRGVRVSQVCQIAIFHLHAAINHVLCLLSDAAMAMEVTVAILP